MAPSQGRPAGQAPAGALFEFDPRDLTLPYHPVRCYDAAADGQRLYAMQARTPPPPSPPVVTHINLIQNWFEELKPKVPPGR